MLIVFSTKSIILGDPAGCPAAQSVMRMRQTRVLWVDDEIDLLQAQVMFLRERGYHVVTATNGVDALERVREEPFDVVFVDEHMPGLSGLETLTRIKEHLPDLPVVMITKSEEEDLMEQAIGSKIADYLIKPVRPQQLLLTLKKVTEQERIREQQTISKYQDEFRELSMKISKAATFREWQEIYRRLIYWDMEMAGRDTGGMAEVLADQRREAEQGFARFVMKNYTTWLSGRGEPPVFSPAVFGKWVFPLVREGRKSVVVVVDNLRYDQWRVLYRLISDHFLLEREEIFSSILPTVTQYARNAMFAGMMPLEIHRRYPQYWRFDEEEGNKNEYEEQLLGEQVRRLAPGLRFAYRKVLNQREGKRILNELNNLLQNDLVVLVYNFIDMLSHARTEMDIIRELARDEKAFRALAGTWFEHSYMYSLIRYLAGQEVTLIITTDHGSIDVEVPVKVIGDRDTTTNLRYKLGRNLNYDRKELFGCRHPEEMQLPKDHITSTFVFAREKQFLVYPKNLNYYSRYYKGTFQHGGISMEEMLIPLAVLQPRHR